MRVTNNELRRVYESLLIATDQPHNPTKRLREAANTLAAANLWLTKTVPCLTESDKWDHIKNVSQIERSAFRLAKLLRLRPFISRGNRVISSGYIGKDS